MATIIDQELDQNPELEEGFEYADIEELGAATSEDISEEVADEDISEDIEEEEVSYELPDKFKGKSVEDIVKSYTELEKEYGRRSNEIGELRKITDEILKSNLQVGTGGDNTAGQKRIEVDDLLENPDEAIDKAIASSPKLKELEEQLIQARREEQRKQFEAKYPSGYDLVSSPEFQSWIGASALRQQLFMKAHTEYDYSVASELIDLYEAAHKGRVEEAKTAQKGKRDKALKDAVTEKGSTGQSSKKIFRRNDLLRMMRSNPTKYNDPAFQEELMKAYQDGRVR